MLALKRQRKNKYKIRKKATLRIGVAFSKFITFGVLRIQVKLKKGKYIEDFFKKVKTQTKL